MRNRMNLINSKDLSKNRQLAINIAASFTALFISMGINFLLSPFIVKTVGVEAYGFVQFGNNIISYLSILAIALNSMSSRFISIEYFRGNQKSANEYFASTFYSNIFLGLLLTPIIIAVILNISKLVNIPIELVLDVQFLLGFLSINFIIGLMATNLSVSYYITNKLYLHSIIQICAHLIKAILLIVFFGLFNPHVSFVALSALIITILTQLANLYWKRKLIPDLKINFKYFRLSRVKELISSGLWNSITRLGSVLSEGLDLLIANLMISVTGMGILSIAKIIPNLINMILNSMISTFLPNMTELYAQKKQVELVASIKQSMRIIGMIINIPIALLIAYGDVLFTVWFPTQDARLLQTLSILTVLPWAFMGQATIIHNIFTIVNRIRLNSILVTLTGFLNVLIVFILLKTTNLGLFAVAGVSAILSILRNGIYTVPFGAKYIHEPWYIFYPDIIKSILSVTSISTIGLLIKTQAHNYTWFNLIILSAVLSFIGVAFNFIIIYRKDDRKHIIDKIKRKIIL